MWESQEAGKEAARPSGKPQSHAHCSWSLQSLDRGRILIPFQKQGLPSLSGTFHQDEALLSCSRSWSKASVWEAELAPGLVCMKLWVYTILTLLSGNPQHLISTLG